MLFLLLLQFRWLPKFIHCLLRFFVRFFILNVSVLFLFQFNGETANKDEKFRATQYVNQLKSERMGKPRLDILEENAISAKHPMYRLLKDGKSKEVKGCS